jgi:predicted RNA-binding Zn-ribbon protein involved in translation (DUF1610 family)
MKIKHSSTISWHPWNRDKSSGALHPEILKSIEDIKNIGAVSIFMAIKHCPGVRDLVEPKIILRTCPACGEEVEFFSDEAEAECPNCGRRLHREASPSCVTWCQYAEACIADLEKRQLIPPSRVEELKRIIHSRGGTAED